MSYNSGSNTPGYSSDGPSHQAGHSSSLSLGNNPNYGESGPSSFGSPSNDDEPLVKREGQIRRGVCKFFNSQKGFGFVLDNNAEELGGQEVFVHFTAIQSRTGFRSLAEGEEVEYEITTGAKGFQATRLTGPGGRPVVGDPKARLAGPDARKQPQFMQLQPIAFPGPYGMDPYIQQHPGAVYAASPYTSHVLYVPSNMHPGQQGQYAPMGGQQQYSPQMPTGGFNGNQRGNYQGQQGQSPGAPYNQTSQGSFGPVGGMASTMGGYGGQQSPQQQGGPHSSYNQAPASTFGGSNNGGSSRYSNSLSGGPGTQLGSYGRGAGGNGQDEYSSYSNDASGNDSSQSQSQPGSNNFFGSGNLLYSSK